MKLELTPQTLELLKEAWLANGKGMADADRPVQRLEQLLFEQPNVRWYQGPGRSWLYFTEATPGQNANMHALNLDGWAAVDVPLVRKILDGAMQDMNLYRLTVAMPAPLTKIQSAAKKLGFVKEGTIREACLYNQKHVDVHIYGLLRRELLGATPPPRRRTRRSRRNKWRSISAGGRITNGTAPTVAG